MKIILISAKAQHGKDLTASLLKEIMEQDGKKVLITHYADLLKYICKTFFNWDGKKDEAGRTILQYVGTDIIRKKEPNYWVDFIAKFLTLFHEWDYVIIPDTRFPNEITRMVESGFDTFTVRIRRTDFESDLTDEQKLHSSETALDTFDFDYYIYTISNIPFLKNCISTMYEKELK